MSRHTDLHPLLGQTRTIHGRELRRQRVGAFEPQGSRISLRDQWPFRPERQRRADLPLRPEGAEPISAAVRRRGVQRRGPLAVGPLAATRGPRASFGASFLSVRRRLGPPGAAAAPPPPPGLHPTLPSPPDRLRRSIVRSGSRDDRQVFPGGHYREFSPQGVGRSTDCRLSDNPLFCKGVAEIWSRNP